MDNILNKLILVENFKSEKNVVKHCKLDGKDVVYKQFSDPECRKAEEETLRDFAVTGYAPRLLYKKDNYIISEYLEGELLSNIYLEHAFTDNLDEIEDIADQLSIFIKMFHTVTKKILFDVNFKNFLVNGDRIYCVDFERVQEGLFNLDIAGVIVNSIIFYGANFNALSVFIKRIMSNFQVTHLDVVTDIKQYVQLYNKSNILKIDYSIVERTFDNILLD